MLSAESTTAAPHETGADTIAIGIFEGEPIAHDVEGGALQALVDSGEAKPGLRKLAVTHAGGRRYLLAGLGKREAFDAERHRHAERHRAARRNHSRADAIIRVSPARRSQARGLRRR